MTKNTMQALQITKVDKNILTKILHFSKENLPIIGKIIVNVLYKNLVHPTIYSLHHHRWCKYCNTEKKSSDLKVYRSTQNQFLSRFNHVRPSGRLAVQVKLVRKVQVAILKII